MGDYAKRGAPPKARAVPGAWSLPETLLKARFLAKTLRTQSFGRMPGRQQESYEYAGLCELCDFARTYSRLLQEKTMVPSGRPQTRSGFRNNGMTNAKADCSAVPFIFDYSNRHLFCMFFLSHALLRHHALP
jgi:hypothetical protein